MILLIFNIYVFILGLIIGSFLNACIYRYQSKESIVSGRSHCTTCNTTLKSIDLIPLFSYIFLKGKCRYCKQPISIQYPIIEALTGSLFFLCYLTFGFSITSLVGLFIIAVLIYAGVIDYKTMIIPDRTHVLLILSAVVLILSDNLYIGNALIGSLIISLPLFIVAYLTKGIGYGDVKLMFSAGFLLGFPNIILAFLVGVIGAGIYASILLLLKKKQRSQEMPLGPWLIFGIILSFLYGSNIIAWYLNLIF